ncbi:hypothetical protein [Ideonella paludis]|uniref:hypothetical protein n=1 Tax=Ideonella paludis TaxID=1233411 RepID=UPI0036403F35
MRQNAGLSIPFRKPINPQCAKIDKHLGVLKSALCWQQDVSGDRHFLHTNKFNINGSHALLPLAGLLLDQLGAATGWF